MASLPSDLPKAMSPFLKESRNITRHYEQLHSKLNSTISYIDFG